MQEYCGGNVSKDMDMEHNLASGSIRGYGMRLYNVIYCFFKFTILEYLTQDT